MGVPVARILDSTFVADSNSWQFGPKIPPGNTNRYFFHSVVTLSDTHALLTKGTIKTDDSVLIDSYSNIAHLLNTQDNTFTAYPGGNLKNGRRAHGSAVIELLDKTKVVVVLGGTNDRIPQKAEKSIIDPENGIFGSWIVDDTFKFRGKFNQMTFPTCESLNKRVFCFFTIDWQSGTTIQEYISWMIPQWRVHKVKTETRSGWNSNEIIIWDA